MVDIKPIPQPSLPTSEPPYDRTLLKGRECQTCACYFESANPEDATKFQGFCRRFPAVLNRIRTMEQRRDRTGAVVIRDGQPVMQPAEVAGFMFALTQRSGTCFDGWRAVGTLPGETPAERIVREAGPQLEQLLETAPRELAQLVRVITQRTN